MIWIHYSAQATAQGRAWCLRHRTRPAGFFYRKCHRCRPCQQWRQAAVRRGQRRRGQILDRALVLTLRGLNSFDRRRPVR